MSSNILERDSVELDPLHNFLNYTYYEANTLSDLSSLITDRQSILVPKRYTKHTIHLIRHSLS